MPEILGKDVVRLIFSLEASVRTKFLERARKGHITRDDDPASHFCVFFAGCDWDRKEVFIGLHRKSGLWLFNGGHMKRGETPKQTLVRGVDEELGLRLDGDSVPLPSLLTITEIVSNPSGSPCRTHYDIWHFFGVNREVLKIDQAKVAEEFEESRWMSINEARAMVVDPATLQALGVLGERFRI